VPSAAAPWVPRALHHPTKHSAPRRPAVAKLPGCVREPGLELTAATVTHRPRLALDVGPSLARWLGPSVCSRPAGAPNSKGYRIFSAAWSDELIELAQLHRMRKPFFVKGGGDVPHNYQDRHWRREFEAWHQAWLAQQPPPRKPVPKRALDNLESSAGFCHKYRLPSS